MKTLLLAFVAMTLSACGMSGTTYGSGTGGASSTPRLSTTTAETAPSPAAIATPAPTVMPATPAAVHATPAPTRRPVIVVPTPRPVATPCNFSDPDFNDGDADNRGMPTDADGCG